MEHPRSFSYLLLKYTNFRQIAILELFFRYFSNFFII